MLILNFAHPLSQAHLARIEDLAGTQVAEVKQMVAQIDVQQNVVPQVMALVDSVGLSPEEWQTLPLLVNPPSLNYIAVTLMAEVHGRCGYFPACLRLRPVADSLVPRYEVAEIINLQEVREAARLKRHDES